VRVDHRLSGGAFDGALVRWVVSTLPLAPGYSARLTSFDIRTNAEVTSTLTVVGAEAVAARVGPVDAWVVESSGGTRRWIAKGSGETVRTRTTSAERTVWTVVR
jgi:hypothetical protein